VIGLGAYTPTEAQTAYEAGEDRISSKSSADWPRTATSNPCARRSRHLRHRAKPAAWLGTPWLIFLKFPVFAAALESVRSLQSPNAKILRDKRLGPRLKKKTRLAAEFVKKLHAGVYR